MGDQDDLRVELVEGIISNTQADVIVNSTNRGLKLSIGALSKSILEGAGPEIQKECNKNYPKGLAWGDLAITDGYKLPCKQVYHGVLPAWDTDEKGVNPKDLLCRLVCSCLQQADTDKATSIAFPTLGCGFLNFPHNEVAMTVCQCIAIFKSEHEKTTLRVIFLVVYNKGQDWKHIKRAFSQELGLEPVQQHMGTGNMFSAARIGASRASGQFRDMIRRRQTRPVVPKQGTSEPKPLVKPSGPQRVPDPLLDTCGREQMHNSCRNILRCGHICQGVKNEKSCSPCLQKGCPGHGALTQSADDNCIICYTDILSAAPVVMLKCKHVYHMHCVKRILDNKWAGARITFNFMCCPICKASIEHPMLIEKMAPLKKIQNDVTRKAMMRLDYEGMAKSEEIQSQQSPYYKKPEQFAMDRYCYYPCFKCKTAYFGGVVQCEQGVAEREFQSKDLICPACSNPDPQQVCQHKDDFLEYKCRYCCSVAVFFCLGNSHLCNDCHNDIGRLLHMPIVKLPNCPAGPCGKQLAGKCPLKRIHPPTGIEFALGCGLCAHLQSF